MAKELLAAFQSEVLGPKDSDCGTKRTLRVKINTKSSKDLYRYIDDNGKLILLTPDNINKYHDKTVDMRTPMFCGGYGKDKCLCNKCAGDYYYIIGKTNIGLSVSKAATTITQLNLQKFHQNLVKTRQLDVNNILI